MFRLSASAILSRNGFTKTVKMGETSPTKNAVKCYYYKRVVTNYTTV